MITTDPQDEVFPLVDERDVVIGSVTRKEANSNPRIIHRAIEVLIYNTLGELLIQKRSSTKDVMPNTWTLSVGGHVNYGDSYDSSAIREIEEEIGVIVEKSRLKLLGKILVRLPWENEYLQVYEYRMLEDTELHINIEEISEVKFVSIQTLYAMLEDATIEWSIFARETLKQFPLR
ncbi:NUDIX domain-containing protein [Candidatus Woesebacteria bacterium]|nr:NUDIX domain-containing protein [Candidatus Woesebacteria bacterium]